MFSIDCAGCPAAPRGCDGCIVDFLGGLQSQVKGLAVDSCGYILAPDVRAAIEVLREVGMLSEIEILESSSAA